MKSSLNKRIKRTTRAVAVGLSAGLLFAACGGDGDSGTGESSGGTIKLTNVTNNDTQAHVTTLFAEELAKQSDGRWKADVFNGGQLGNEQTMIEMVQTGATQSYTAPTSNWVPFVPDYAVFDLPFLFDDYDDMYKTINDDVMDYFSEKAEGKGLKPLFYYPYSEEMIGLISSSEINSYEHIKGKRFRTKPSQLIEQMYKQWGATSISMSLTEVYTSLEQGAIDGFENHPALWEATKLYEVAPHFTQTSHSTSVEVFMVSKKWFDDLAPDDQELIMDVARAVQEHIPGIVSKNDAAAREKLDADDTATISTLPDEDLQHLRDMVIPVWEKAYQNQEYKAALKELGQVTNLLVDAK